jgi:hypothetical protein
MSPDNTIVRIEKLEEELADLLKKYQAEIGKVPLSVPLETFNPNTSRSNDEDLVHRVQALEAGQIV